ncbi:hypothetical protein [Pseudoroseomonas cervicalis]|uniref:hypothetical protein n=1 Tax=Teichococcus cervicalis TaxID=204525 RepID=UPI0027876FAF|nr:hypothetical protein [Pseudoroseomonas cervicalis]MDQ1081447.1 hypothetical protein [Pseudoroseomonas cervicalis]
MAKLDSLRVNARAMREGEWIDLPEGFDGLRLLVRAQGRAYLDGRAKLMKEAAEPYGGKEELIPEEVLDEVSARAAGQHLLIDVENLHGAHGPVTVEQYRDLMIEPDRLPLVTAVFIASGQVGRKLDIDQKVAEGNSGTSSAGG